MTNKNLPKIQKGAVGLTMTFQTGISLLNTTTMQLVLRVGNEVKTKTLTADNITDANLGTVVYTTREGDLDIVGTYSGQLIDTSTGVYFPSEVFQFQVVNNVT